MVKLLFSELWADSIDHWSADWLFPIVFSMALTKETPSLNSLLNLLFFSKILFSM